MPTPQNQDIQGEFNSGGPQYNNTGSGHQFSGANFNASVIFNDQRDASHDNYSCLEGLQCAEPFEVKNRLKGDKDRLVSEATEWIFDDSRYCRWRNEDNEDNENKTRLLWIRGGAGKGKTMMTIRLIEKLLENNSNVTYFFCQNGYIKQNTIEGIIKGLIWQLIQQRAELIEYLQRRWDAVRSRFKESMTWKRFWNIFLEMLHHCPRQRVYIVVDALDECQDQDMNDFLKVIVRTGLDDNHVRWLLTSRPLDSADQELLTTVEQDWIRLELNYRHVEAAIKIYVDHKVDELYPGHHYELQTRQRIASELVKRAEGTFLWVSVVCKSLEGGASHNRVSPDKALRIIRGLPSNLYSLYERMFTQITEGDSALVNGCIRLLEVMMLVYQPLEMAELPSVTGFSETEVARSVNRCASFIKMRGGCIEFVHQSCREFWARTSLSRSYDQYGHGEIALNCLSYISTKLKVNQLNLSLPNSTRQMAEEKVGGSEEMKELHSMSYAATFWADHLGDAKPTRLVLGAFDTDGQVMTLLRDNLLEWLECLSLLGELSHAIKALKRLESIAEGSDLHIRIFDAKRFLLRHYHTISTWPIQIYSSAIVFSPQDSIVRANHIAKASEWLKRIPPVEMTWEPLTQTFEGHSFWVNAVAFSPDGMQIASGSEDKTIRLWDISTGDCLMILKGHESAVNAIAFSPPDGKQLASASSDTTIRLWDISTDTQHPKILRGHKGSVNAVAFSPDGKQLASASHDTTVQLWDLSTDTQRPKILQGNSDWVNAIAFSLPDGKQIASASTDKTVRLWDINLGNDPKILQGHSAQVKDVAFSLDGKQIASVSDDKTIRLWDISANTQYPTILQGHINSVNAVAFSPDGKQIASASSDNTIQLWDKTRSIHLKTLRSPSAVNAIAFSSDGKQIASASNDNIVRLWDTTIDDYQILQSHPARVNAVIFSPDGKQAASISNDRNIWLWDISTGEHQILRGHSTWVTALAFSPDNKLLASASNDKTARLWNISMGEHQILQGHSDWVTAIAISPDCMKIASGSNDMTIQLWDTSAGKRRMLRGHSDWVRDVVFSLDSNQIASASNDKTIRLWNISTGDCIKILQGHENSVNALAFFPDGARIASASEDKTVRLWDVSAPQQRSVRMLGAFRKVPNIKCYHQIKTPAPITSLKFSSNGQFLHTQLGGIIRLGKTENCNNSKNDLYLENGWICYRSTQIFRILPGLLPTCYDVRDDHIAIGCRDGRVLFLEFDCGKLDEIVSASLQ